MIVGKRVGFRIADPESILKLSVMEVTSPRLIKPKARNFDENGLLSLRMGSLDRRVRCATCENDTLRCPGHFGHIVFAAPIYHFGFLKKIVKVLRGICYWCTKPYRVVVAPAANSPAVQGAAGTCRESSCSESTVDSSKPDKMHCPHCSGSIPKYIVDGHKIRIMWPPGVPKKNRTLPAAKTLSILERALFMGFLDPELATTVTSLKNSVMTVMIVPPPCVRPSTGNESSKVRGQDDLTRLLVNIVAANTKLRENIDSPANLLGKPDPQLVAALQWNVSSYMHNDIRGEKKSTNRTGGTTRDLRTRLVGKNGRVRNTLMGKRVNHSARDVITPSVFLDVDQVGVPQCIADTLLKVVTVTTLNLALMKRHLQTGVIKYVHVRKDGKEVRTLVELPEVLDDRDSEKKRPASMSRTRAMPDLQVGWKVERSMLDGDLVCMNRHPSLHRMSMMGHRTKVLPRGQLTFQLNPAVCPPYNADFDGDEMNLHLPTTFDAESELQELFSVRRNVMSPQNSRLSLGAVQDCALGVYMLSDEACALDRDDFFQLIFAADGVFRDGLPPNGRGVLSAFLPDGFCYASGGLVIERGVVLEGRLNRANIHAVIATLCLDYSSDRAVDLLRDWQMVACAYVSMRGFSINMDDCTMDADSKEAVQSYLESSIARIDGSLADDATKNAALGSILGNLASVARRNTSDSNAIVIMASSGAKGNSVNLTQIRSAVGQQNVNGARALGCLPGFAKDCVSCERFGFIRSSYTSGLNPTEFFHHAMSGREGIVDTAVKTAETGYLGRRLAKGFESVKTFYGDLSVRNAFGEILQFSYGNDGYDPMWLERVSLDSFIAGARSARDARDERVLPNYRAYRSFVAEYFLKSRGSRTVFLPCDPARICLQARHRSGPAPATFAAESSVAETEGLIGELLECLGGLTNRSTVVYQAAIVATLRSGSHFHQIVPREFDRRWVLRELLDRHCRALASAGEMVGIVAAQSIAQPATQLTLNTFHYAGVAAFNVTLGLPRLKELTDASQESQSPSMVIPLRRHVNPQLARRAVISKRLGHFICGEFLAVPREDIRRHLGMDVDIAAAVCDLVEVDVFRCAEMAISPAHLLKAVSAFHRVEPTTGFCSLPCDDRWWLVVPSRKRSAKHFSKIRVSGTEVLDSLVSATVHTSEAVSRCTPFPIDSAEFPNVLITAGSCLEALFSTIDPAECDVFGVYSNNLLETYSVLGVEAAAAMLFSELRQVLSFDGTFVHDRHFQLIVDVMTRSGSIVPLSRHGLNKNMNTGILARASFEATVDQLLDGALRGEIDHLRGVSENIFLGLYPPMGTGIFDLTTVRKALLPGKIESLSPGAVGAHVGNVLPYPESLSRIMHLANLLAPFESSSFDNGLDSIIGRNAKEQSDNEIPDATACSDICSQMNEFLPVRDGPFRPSSPVPFEQFLEETSGYVDPMVLDVEHTARLLDLFF